MPWRFCHPSAASRCGARAARSPARSPTPGTIRRRTARTGERKAPVVSTAPRALTRPGVGRDRPRRPRAQALHPRVLEDPHAQLERRPLQSPRELRRVQDARAAALPQARAVERRAHLRAHRFGGPSSTASWPSAAQLLRLLREPFLFVRLREPRSSRRSTRGRTRPHGAPGRERLVEVLAAEPLERRQLVREALEAVADAVRQRRHEEPAAVARRARRDPVSASSSTTSRCRLVLLRLDRRPQAAEPAADDHEVRFRFARSAGRAPARAAESSQNERGAASA